MYLGNRILMFKMSFNSKKKESPKKPYNYINSFKSEAGYLDEDSIECLSKVPSLARNGIPQSHKRLADNYMIIKKIYGFSAVQSRISFEERKVLARYGFNTLENSTIRQIVEELGYIKKWAFSRETKLVEGADKIIEIRAKELKYLSASNYVDVSNEIYQGYKALEKYFEEISKYQR